MKIYNYWIGTYAVRFNNKSWTKTWVCYTKYVILSMLYLNDWKC